MENVNRGSSAPQPDDGHRGRPGWSAGGRRRVPQQPSRGEPRHEGRPPHRSEPPPRSWSDEPPPRQRTTYRPDGYPPDEREPRREPPYRPAGRPAYRDDHRDDYRDDYEAESVAAAPLAGDRTAGPRTPKKLTVTRVAAYRGRQLSQQAVNAFRRAAQADGAHESGLTALTYAVMLNYASSATMAVGLANTLFFSAATGESRTKVALYLLITVAPFALIAPVVGPMLDRIQRGRRLALAVSCVGQGLLAVVMALHLNDWLLYPAALGTLVLSKSFDVLKSSVTPRVLPKGMTLSRTNARLTVFGLFAGLVFGGVAGGFSKVFGSPGALWFTAVLCIADAVLCLGIPAWVEVTEGEVPASLRAEPNRPKRQPMGRHVVIALWGNGAIRLMTGFLMLFPAFVIKSLVQHSAFKQLLLLGLVAGAAGVGSFVGSFVGARLQFGKPDQVIIGCLAGCVAGGVLAAMTGNVTTAAIAALIASVASALAKISLDATIQNDLPDASRASAFGRSETVLQLTWVFGGALGVLLPTTFWLGFSIVSVLLVFGLVQTVFLQRGRSLLPALGGGWRPTRPNVMFRTRSRPSGEDVDPAEAPTKVRTRTLPTERTEYP